MKQIIAIGGGGFGRVIKDLKIEKYIKSLSTIKITICCISVPNITLWALA